MKESEFIRQNKKRWEDFEAALSSKEFNPNRVAKHYIETIDDLSFARTHYKNRLVRSYLNGVSQILSLRIYKTQKGTIDGIRKFWSTDLPLIMYHSRRELLISFLVFVASMMIGAFSANQDAEFVRQIMGDGYVDMTIANIEKGDPMAVYKQQGMGDMFFGITLNNLFVAARTFIFGVFAGLGTIFILIYNGIMLGSFQYFFFEYGVGFESILTIWQHGTIEIFSIILAGAAGLALARGLLFPGTYSRIDAFRISGRKGLMMMLGLMPLLVYSGFIEAVVTRLTETHWMFRLSTIVGSLLFVILYFVWYPRRVANRNDLSTTLKINLQPISKTLYDKNQIVSNPVIVGEVMSQLQMSRAVMGWLVLVVGSIGAFLLTKTNYIIDVSKGYRDHGVPEIYEFVLTGENMGMFFLNIALIFLAHLFASTIFKKYADEEDRWKKAFIATRKTWLFTLLSAIVCAVLLTSGWMVFALIFWGPISLIATCTMLDTSSPTSNGIGHILTLYKKGWFKITLVTTALGFIGFMALVLFNEFIIKLLFAFIPGFLPDGAIISRETLMIFLTSFLILSIYLFFYTLIFLVSAFSYYSMLEQATAKSLMKQVIDNFPLDESEPTTKNILNKRKLSSI